VISGSTHVQLSDKKTYYLEAGGKRRQTEKIVKLSEILVYQISYQIYIRLPCPAILLTSSVIYEKYSNQKKLI